jgi:hypothetical protein
VADTTELTLLQKQQMEAIRLLNDWSKWVVTIETASIAGIFTWLTKPVTAGSPRGGWVVAADVVLIAAAVCFAVSIAYAAALLFALPDIVEQLPKATQESINDMTGNYMSFSVLVYERGQWWAFIAGLVLVILAALLLIGVTTRV